LLRCITKFTTGKMMTSTKVLLSIGLLLAAAASTMAFKCYLCIPEGDKDCTKEEDRVLTDCKGTNPYCRKMEQNVLGTTQYVYQCAEDAAGREKLYYNTANDYVKASVYHCLDEQCNGASHKMASGFAATLIVAVAWMLH